MINARGIIYDCIMKNWGNTPIQIKVNNIVFTSGNNWDSFLNSLYKIENVETLEVVFTNYRAHLDTQQKIKWEKV